VSYIGQAHLRTTLRPRHLALAVLVGMLIASLMAASAATASDVTVSNCAKLQPILNAAEAGEVITLAALCTASNSGSVKGSFTLPPSTVANVTIEGQSGMAAGFEGTGVSGSALRGTGNGLVLRNLVVENYSLKEKSAVSLTPTEGALPKLEADHFLDDTDSTSNASTHGGALDISASNATCAYTAPLSISGSEFDGDQISDTATNELSDVGGAVSTEIRCTSASATPVDFATLTANKFIDDSIDTVKGREVFGGALYLANRSSAGVLVSATQSGDLFEADTIAATTPTKAYGGGGEWAPSIDLTSTGDRFVKNSLPGPQVSSASSEGAGLGVPSATCAEGVTTSAVLEDAVIAANTIGAASEDGQSEGAGIFAGCVPAKPNAHFQLTLNDSTVAGNQAPRGIAGVDGGESDQLALSNSIVTSPSGQADIGGFQTVSGGSLTSSFSDACKPDTSIALPGEGDICTNPLLASAETGEVEESPSSPTIDAGSNALVPAGLTTDAFGHARILAGHVSCSQSFPAIVDMGADEFTYGYGALSCPAPFTPRPPVPGLTQYISRKASPTGLALKLSCTSTDGLGCSGTIFLTTDEILQGKKVIAVGASRRTRGSARLGQAPFALAAGATATFTVKLNSTGLQLLRHFHAISAFLLANEASPTSTPFIFLLDGVRFSEPKKQGSKTKKQGSKKHGHKPQHPKPRH
jgi:hypothetical protein